jgi:hypothetical protein
MNNIFIHDVILTMEWFFISVKIFNIIEIILKNKSEIGK